MGRRDRERIERILSGDEAPIATQRMGELSGFNQKIVHKVGKITETLVKKTMAPKWMKMDLPQQVAVAQKMMKAAGLVNFRSTFLKDSGFPSDIQDKLEAGETPEQIRRYYWDCPEWVAFWKCLELNEDHFETLLGTKAAKDG